MTELLHTATSNWCAVTRYGVSSSVAGRFTRKRRLLTDAAAVQAYAASSQEGCAQQAATVQSLRRTKSLQPSSKISGPGASERKRVVAGKRSYGPRNSGGCSHQ